MPWHPKWKVIDRDASGDPATSRGLGQGSVYKSPGVEVGRVVGRQRADAVVDQHAEFGAAKDHRLGPARLQPGDRIDILFTTTAANESVTVPLLLSVPVIATGLRTQANANSLPDKLQGPFRTITVSVTPSDAAKITLAQEAGRITVALRQPQDLTLTRIARITKNALLKGDEQATASRPRARVQIILGGV